MAKTCEVSEVLLSRKEFGFMTAISDKLLADGNEAVLEGIVLNTCRSLSMRCLNLTASMAFYGDEYGFEWPTNWLQAVKERFAPHWVLNRWPVLYDNIKVFEVFPTIKAKRLAPYVAHYFIDHKVNTPRRVHSDSIL